MKFIIVEIYSDNTFIDELLTLTKVHKEADKLRCFIIGEEYDTDSIKSDITKAFDGNINANKFGDEIPTRILIFIQQIECV